MKKPIIYICIALSLSIGCIESASDSKYTPPSSQVDSEDSLKSAKINQVETFHKALYAHLNADPLNLFGEIKHTSTNWSEGYTIVKLEGQPSLQSATDSTHFQQDITYLVQSHISDVKIYLNDWELSALE